MAEFLCLAKDKSGSNQKVSVEAESVRSAVSMLRKRGLVAISVTQARARRKANRATRGRRRRVKLKDVALFCRQLSVMLEAGLAMVDSVKDIAEQVDNLRFRDVLLDSARRMEAGETFSATVARHPKVFGELFVNMSRAGEEGGSLAKVLSDLSSYLEDQVALRRKVKGATAYPAFIAVFFFGAVGAIVFLLIPRFEKIFKGFGAELPLLTRIIMGASHLIVDNVIFLILGVGLAIFGLVTAHRTSKGHYMIDQALLRVPIFGKLLHKVALTRFTRALATLLENGIAMVSGLEIASSISGNVVMAEAIDNCRSGIIQGSSLTSELRRESLFPPMLTQMASAGEQSGRMSSMLRRFAKFSDDEVTTAVEGLTAIIEPLLIILLGGVVAIVVLAIYLPIFQMAGQMH